MGFNSGFKGLNKNSWIISVVNSRYLSYLMTFINAGSLGL